MRMKPGVKKTEFFLVASLRLSGSIASQINCEQHCVQMTSQKRDPPPRLRQTLAIPGRGRKNAVWKRRVCDQFCSSFQRSSFEIRGKSRKIQSRTNQNIAQVQRIEAERKIRELLNAVSRYLICSPVGKCFQRILINFDDCVEISIPLPKQKESQSYHIFDKFFVKNRRTYVVYIQTTGPFRFTVYRPRDSRFEYAQAWGIRPLQDQTCFSVAWRLRTNIKCFRQASMIIFPDILKTDCLRHAGEVLKTTRIHKIPKVDD